MPNWVSDADVDEVSTVDLPANQHGLFVLTKRATPEEHSVDYFDAEGQPVDITTLGVGDWFQDDQGQAFQWTDDQGSAQTADGQQVVFGYEDEQADEPAYDGPAERELELVGKSAFLQGVSKSGDDLFAKLSKSLEDAIADDGARNQIAKAFADQQVELQKAQAQASQAYTIAKAAQDREEQRVFIAKAAEYEGLPVPAEELGPVMHRMTKALSFADCAIIAKCLEHTGDIFKQYGIDGDPGTDDVFDQVEKYMAENASDVLAQLGKSATGPEGRTQLSKEGAVTAFFDTNPREYSALKRGRR